METFKKGDRVKWWVPENDQPKLPQVSKATEGKWCYGHVVDINTVPITTQYLVQPEDGKVTKVMSLELRAASEDKTSE